MKKETLILSFGFVSCYPGAGKDVHSNQVARANRSIHKQSTGDIFRGAVLGNGPFKEYHKFIAEYAKDVDNGGYLPEEVVTRIFRSYVEEKVVEGETRFLFTGYPRTEGQLDFTDAWFDYLRDNDVIIAERHVFLDVPPGLAMLRAIERRDTNIVKRVKPREDDTVENLERRVQEFELTKPMINKLRRSGRLSTVTSVGDFRAVHQKFVDALGSLYGFNLMA